MEYYIIDTETTGLKAGHHEITDISIVRCTDRAQLTKKIKIDHPDRVSMQALEVTGRNYEDILGGEDKFEVVERCEEFWREDGLTPEHRCMVAHNAPFDKRFCHALWEDVGKEFPVVCWMDTIKFAKTWAKEIGVYQKSFKLELALKFAGISELPGAHTAAGDARNTYLLWKKGMDNGVDHLPAIQRYPHIIK